MKSSLAQEIVPKPVYEAHVRVEVGLGGGGEPAGLHAARERLLHPLRSVSLGHVVRDNPVG